MGVTLRFYRAAWWVFINHHGRRKAKKVGDRATAEALAKVLRERLARADLNLPSNDAQTLATYAHAWLTIARQSLKASTVAFYDSNLDRYILPMFGSRPVSTFR